MQDERQSRIAAALSNIEKLARACCTQPDYFNMRANVGSVLIGVAFDVHHHDVRTIVGASGKNLAQFAFLLRRMLEGTGMEADIEDVKGVGNDSGRYDKSAPNKNWPKNNLVKLLADVAKACYPEQRTAVETKEGADRTRLNVLFEREPEFKHDFARAVALLYLPIGKCCGHRITVDVKVVNTNELER